MAVYLPFPYALGPTTSASRTVQPRVLKTDFGDGYGQRLSDGINSIRRIYSLSWDDISRVDANTIDDFFLARKGHEAFYWTPPGASSPLLWVCETWTRVHSTATLDSIQATFTQVFDL
jgi:phage-related protein